LEATVKKLIGAGLIVLAVLLVAGLKRNDKWINVVSAAGEWGVVLVIYGELENNRKASIKEATDKIFKKWWGEDMRKLRQYFFYEFVPQYRALLVQKNASMKSIPDLVEDDRGRATQFCYFFDRVGWLGAADLIDVDYLLGPMQHAVRRAWWVMEPFIRETRATSSKGNLDPVFQYGFEWLYRRSSRPAKHQANLVRNRFQRPRLLTAKNIRDLRRAIDADETTYRQNLLKSPSLETQLGGGGGSGNNAV
jgi:hypothetical protein